MSEQTQVEANKKIAREYIQRVFNEHQPDLANDYVTPDVVCT
jgi:predicted SnoaL-like aldol condensation-catalyzing enzyme